MKKIELQYLAVHALASINKALFILNKKYAKDSCEDEDISKVYEELLEAGQTLNELV